jgi:hypothetical protein
MVKRCILLGVFVLFGRRIQSTRGHFDGFFTSYDALDSAAGLTREQRFPSVEDRLKVYMSNWYIPPCEGYDDGLIKYSYNQSNDNNSEWPSLLIHTIPDRGNHSVHQIESIIEPDRILFLDTDTARDCASTRIDQGSNQKYHGRVLVRQNMFMYCVDVADTLMTALDHVDFEEEKERQPVAGMVTQTPPTLMQFGDLMHSHVYAFLDLPHFKKFRSAATSLQDLEKVTTGKACWSSQRDSLQTIHSKTNLQVGDDYRQLALLASFCLVTLRFTSLYFVCSCSLFLKIAIDLEICHIAAL